MADFHIHRLTATIADGNSTVTLTESTDYTLQRGTPSASYAFAKVVGINRWGLRTGGPDEGAAWITHTTDITADFILNRYGTAGDAVFEIEIWEYLGSVGGANEFILRSTSTVVMPSGSTVSSATISGVVTDADIVPFLTGMSGQATPTNQYDRIQATAEWNAGNDQIDFTRVFATANDATYSFAVVEFVGSNWVVQDGTYTIVTAGSAQTLTMPDQAVASVTKAFLECTYRGPSGVKGNDDMMAELWITGTDEISSFQESTGTTGGVHAFFVIENIQSDGTPIVVQVATGTAAATSTAEAITAVSDMDITSISGMSGRTTQTVNNHTQIQTNFKLTTTTNVQVTKQTTDGITYRFAVVEWPTVAAGGGPTGFTQRSYPRGANRGIMRGAA